MSPSNESAGVIVTKEALDRLMPMHLCLDRGGAIAHFGPTARKLWQDTVPIGAPFWQTFALRRPATVKSLDDLKPLIGQPLHLRAPDQATTPLKGVLVPLGAGDGYLVNLSFGISIVDAVRRFQLTIADFAPTELTVEMLYLVEARSAVMAESRKLMHRLQGAKIAAEEQAYTDALTGLKNRRAMDHVMGRFLEAGEGFGLMHLDLDYFKRVNDTLGHAAGDHVLQHVARVLLEETRSEDLVARVGGDEFVLIFNGLTEIDTLNEIAARIIGQLEQPIHFKGAPCRISGSIGTTVTDYYPSPAAERMLQDADTALYASKDKGRACFTVYTEALKSLGETPVLPRVAPEKGEQNRH